MRCAKILGATLLLAACSDTRQSPTASLDGNSVDIAPAFAITPAAALTDPTLKSLLLGAAGTSYTRTSNYAPLGLHAGIDYANGKTGGAVYAPVAGQVIGDQKCGKVIILDDFGNSVILLHMINIIAPAAGGRVRQGDKVGEVGSTQYGNCTSTGPHLHIEVRKGRHLAAALPGADNRTGTFDPRVYLSGPAGYGARFGGYSRLPGIMWPGVEYPVGLVMQNTGPTPWDLVQQFKLGSQAPQDNGIWGTGGRAALPGSVAPGQVVDIPFRVRAPATPGTYNFQWRMLQEGVAWFGEFSTNQLIRVLQPIGVVSLMHGKCLDAPSAVNGTRVHMWDCIPGNLNQRWGYSPETGALRVHGEKCLDATTARALAAIVVHDCHGGTNQQWDFTTGSQLRLRHHRDPSGAWLCTDIGQYSRRNGAQLILYTCHAGENQQWRRDTGGVGGSTVSIATALQPGMCIDASAATRGTELHLWDCLGAAHANQRFRRTPERTLVVHGKCVDAHNGRAYDPVKVWDCHGGANQQWDLTPSGEFRGINNLCIDVRGASSARGTRMMLHPCHGGSNQRWSFRDPSR